MPVGIGYYVIKVPDVLRARDFYRNVLGWRFRQDGHVEGSQPAGGIAEGAGEPGIDTYFMVDDARSIAAAVRELGGTASEPERSPSGWSAWCTDDQGGRFAIWQPSAEYAPDGPPKPGEGDLFYFVLAVGDDEQGKRFYGELFGWEFTPGTHARGWNIVNAEPPGGLFGAGSPAPVSVYFQVGDIEAARARVLEANGTAGPVRPNQAGWHVDCRDDQGVNFSLGATREA